MPTLTHSTKPIKAGDITHQWHLVDANKKILGQVAGQIAGLLMGKKKVSFTNHLDGGDYVVVINAEKVALTGSKRQNKTYSRYSGYPGGLKKIPFEMMLEKRPQEVIRHAVMGMLPKNKLRDRMIVRLHIYQGEEHPHEDKFATQNTKS